MSYSPIILAIIIFAAFGGFLQWRKTANREAAALSAARWGLVAAMAVVLGAIFYDQAAANSEQATLTYTTHSFPLWSQS